MITIICNDNSRKEREYIYDVIFQEFLGIEYKVIYEKRKDVLLKCDSAILYMSDRFFQQSQYCWLGEESLPQLPLRIESVPEEIRYLVTEGKLPIIYEDKVASGLFSALSDNNTRCTLDIFGSAFFMLTRYEEIVNQERDQYDRFSAKSSIAFKENFLHRPIINEYIELLWGWIHSVAPYIQRKKHKYRIMPTHDVDVPYLALSLNVFQKIKTLLGAIIKRRNWWEFKENLQLFLKASMGDYSSDPRDNFDYIMGLSEKYKLTSSFYFMTARGRDIKDGNYNIVALPIVELAKKIIARGHNIGIHPGFGSYKKLEYVENDVNLLRDMLQKFLLKINKFGGRQHYLSWEAPTTWELYEENGIEYDTTLSYADCIGFRCGICWDYPVYNCIKHEAYRLREYPLIVMDCTLWDKRYMDLDKKEMLSRCVKLKEKCQKYEGNFVILWHNTSFMELWQRELYESILNS